MSTRDLADQDLVASVLSEYHDRRILDVGSSDTTGLTEAAPEDSYVVQMDRYRDTLQEGYEKKQEYTTDAASDSAQANAKEMPFEDDSYDVVFAGHSINPPELSGIEDERGDGQPEAWEQELGRVLKDGGDLIVQQGLYSDVMDREEMLRSSGMQYREQAFDEVEKRGSLLIMRGYDSSKDPGEPTPQEQQELARQAAEVKQQYEDPDSPGRSPLSVYRDVFDVDEE